MSISRLRTGEWFAAVGAVGLLVSLLVLHWFVGGEHVHGIAGWYSYPPLSQRLYLRARMHDLTGWDAMGTLRWFVLVTVALGLALALAQAASRGPALPVTLDLLATLVAGLTTILLVIRLATASEPLRFGAVVGVLAAVATTFGAFRAMRAEQGWAVSADRPVELVEL